MYRCYIIVAVSSYASSQETEVSLSAANQVRHSCSQGWGGEWGSTADAPKRLAVFCSSVCLSLIHVGLPLQLYTIHGYNYVVVWKFCSVCYMCVAFSPKSLLPSPPADDYQQTSLMVSESDTEEELIFESKKMSNRRSRSAPCASKAALNNRKSGTVLNNEIPM